MVVVGDQDESVQCSAVQCSFSWSATMAAGSGGFRADELGLEVGRLRASTFSSRPSA